MAIFASNHHFAGYIMCAMSTAQAVSPRNNATLWGSAAAWGSLLSMNFGAGLAKHLFPVIGAYGMGRTMGHEHGHAHGPGQFHVHL